jgi:4-hydroxy-4-methyl-2-oxoglutarate aldolase
MILLSSGRELLSEQHDVALYEFAEKNLYRAVVSDSMDQLGVRNPAMREARFEIEAEDSLLPGEVDVTGTQKSIRDASRGELLSTASRTRGTRGAIVEGLVRHVQKIEELRFPVFAIEIKPADSLVRGRVTAFDVPVECREVPVHADDFVFADFDGVVVVPKAIVRDVTELSPEKVRRENSSRAELTQGAYLRDVFQNYGVL